MSQKIEPERIRTLNDKEENTDQEYVLYWMQQSQRAEYNHALEFALEKANDLKMPLLVVFSLMDDYPEANLRHYYFMVEGLKEVQQALQKRNIRMIVAHGHPAEVALNYADKAGCIVTDMGYLRHHKEWRKKVAREAKVKVWQIESDLIVPVEVTSPKQEYAARTIRSKIHKHLDKFLNEVKPSRPQHSSLDIKDNGLDISDVEKACAKLKLDTSIKPVPQFFKGGTSQAQKRFKNFLKDSLPKYNKNRNQAQSNDISHMSMYLHFGQISAIWLAREALQQKSKEDVDSYIEELLVRRELAANYCYYNPEYDSFKSIPEWAQKTLEKHKSDNREHVYSRKQLEDAQTHDEYWNASMREMRYTGFMHNYMRMYWGKKILEWSHTPEHAYRTTLAINNKYFLDGRDHNSFTNVSWIFGLHDRAWQENDIFGKIRSMKASGLERKFDVKAYIKKVDDLVEKAEKS
ncbi:MAG: deoxyribodipyrimidine photo-lyase [Cyclobacteriaceae bacterium]